MRFTNKTYFDEYFSLIGNEIPKLVSAFNFRERNGNLEYRTQVSVVYSSNIEGNSIDLNSFMNFKLSNQKPKPLREWKEIEYLILAYSFAQTNQLNEKNLLKAHKILSKQLVISSLRGKYRNDKVGVFSESGLFCYRS